MKKQERGICQHRRDGKDGVDETPFRVSVIFFLLWYITSFFSSGKHKFRYLYRRYDVSDEISTSATLGYTASPPTETVQFEEEAKEGATWTTEW